MFGTIIRTGVRMKNKNEVGPHTLARKKPAKAHLTDAEFRRRLKNISEWRKKRLAKPHTKNTS
jgi:hypothetical protein